MANIVLGGGIGGLSAAYYLSKNCSNGVKLFEATGRVGGWIKSVKNEKDLIFEKGPRTVRVYGPAGDNTLRLISDLGLETSVLPVLRSSNAAKNRMIYADGKFCLLPNKVSDLFKIIPPLKKPLIMAGCRYLITSKKIGADESLYNFVARTLGQDIADYIISPLACGIVAGDAKELSAKLLFRNQLEKKQGTYNTELKARIEKWLVWFLNGGPIPKDLNNFLKNKSNSDINLDSKCKKNELENNSVSLIEKARNEGWLVWTLSDGLETLPKALNNYLENESNAEINLNSKCKKIELKKDSVSLTFKNGKTETAEKLYCSLPCKTVASLLSDEHNFLKQELSSIPYVTVGVVNLAFEGNILPKEAFGYLIPPKEKSPVLGVTFDTASIPQGKDTVVTVMMGGKWFGEHFGEHPDEKNLLEIAVDHVKKNFPTDKDPICSHASILRDCIPQYIVGHYEKVEKINRYIFDHKLPISLIGNSYKGVGVNDVIYSAKQAVQNWQS